MATEDFTTYTETDPNSKIAVTAGKVAGVTLAAEDAAYVYDDKGAAFFDGDWNFDFELQADADVAGGYNWIMAAATNTAGIVTTDSNAKQGTRLYENASNVNMCVHEVGNQTCLSTAVSKGTLYYITCIRDEAASTNGDLTVEVYTDSARTTLHESISVSLGAKVDFRYMNALGNYGAGPDSSTNTMFIQNLDLAPSSGPTIDVNDSINISENVSLIISNDLYPSVSDSINISENVTADPILLPNLDVSDALTITENISFSVDLQLVVSDSLFVTDIATIDLFQLNRTVSVNDILNISENVSSNASGGWQRRVEPTGTWTQRVEPSI